MPSSLPCRLFTCGLLVAQVVVIMDFLVQDKSLRDSDMDKRVGLPLKQVNCQSCYVIGW